MISPCGLSYKKIMEVIIAEVTAFLTALTATVTSVSAMAGNVMTTIAGNEMLLTFCTVPLVGIGIGFAKRLIHIGR